MDDLLRGGMLRRLAVVTYSGRVHVAAPLAERHDDDAVGVLRALPFRLGHGRNISGALRLTRTQVACLYTC